MVAGGGNAPPSIWLMRPFGSLDLPATEIVLWSGKPVTLRVTNSKARVKQSIVETYS
jgi:hypothetical protein